MSEMFELEQTHVALEEKVQRKWKCRCRLAAKSVVGLMKRLESVAMKHAANACCTRQCLALSHFIKDLAPLRIIV